MSGKKRTTSRPPPSQPLRALMEVPEFVHVGSEPATVETEVDSTEASAVAVEPKTEVKILETKSVATSAVGVPAGSLTEVPMHEQPKQGGKCCGCCCDFRQAVIVLSIIGIVASIVEICFPRLPMTVTDDDVSIQIMEIHTWADRATTVVAIVGLAVEVLNLVGAIIFIWQLNAVFLWYSLIQFGLKIYFTLTRQIRIFDVLENLYDDDTTDDVFEAIERLARFSALVTYIASGVILVLWDYPTLFFIIETRKGIMTKESYPREQYACCGAPRRQAV